MSNSWCVVNICLLLTLCAGCNSSTTSRTGAQGKVSYEGKPIEHGQIELYPINGTTGPMVGSAIEQGSYSITSENGPQVGGTYQVRITGMRKTGAKVASRDRPEENPGDRFENYVPDIFNSKSQLKVSIDKQDPNQLDFSLPLSSQTK